MDRSEVFARDGFRCVYCGRGEPEVELSVDHVEPRMRGGDSSPGNLVTACSDCNLLKGGRAAWAFLEDRPLERASFLDRATYVWPRLRRAVIEAAAKAKERKRRKE
jgi:5-methylcytosine-specific restriction endonuclease McrA